MPETAGYWAHGDAYEQYMGRWSRLVAERFVRELDAGHGLRWLDVGCGTGALSSVVLDTRGPVSLVGVDPSEGFLDTARARFADAMGLARFEPADAAALPLPDASADVVVSGLVLTFVPSPEEALAEFTRVAAPGGTVAGYVWDYADGMPLMSTFWDAAVALDPAADALDQSVRFTRWRPDFLHALWAAAPRMDAASVAVFPIEVDAVFTDFDDYWTPFLGGQGPAPAYAMSLDAADRETLRLRVRAALPTAADGSITLRLRAWGVVGRMVDASS